MARIAVLAAAAAVSGCWLAGRPARPTSPSRTPSTTAKAGLPGPDRQDRHRADVEVRRHQRAQPANCHAVGALRRPRPRRPRHLPVPVITSQTIAVSLDCSQH